MKHRRVVLADLYKWLHLSDKNYVPLTSFEVCLFLFLQSGWIELALEPIAHRCLRDLRTAARRPLPGHDIGGNDIGGHRLDQPIPSTGCLSRVPAEPPPGRTRRRHRPVDSTTSGWPPRDLTWLRPSPTRRVVLACRWGLRSGRIPRTGVRGCGYMTALWQWLA